MWMCRVCGRTPRMCGWVDGMPSSITAGWRFAKLELCCCCCCCCSLFASILALCVAAATSCVFVCSAVWLMRKVRHTQTHTVGCWMLVVKQHPSPSSFASIHPSISHQPTNHSSLPPSSSFCFCIAHTYTRASRQHPSIHPSNRRVNNQYRFSSSQLGSIEQKKRT